MYLLTTCINKENKENNKSY